MTILRFLLRLFTGCRHDTMYRERREIDGRECMALICDDCGYTEPALARTPEEHAKAQAFARGEKVRASR